MSYRDNKFNHFLSPRGSNAYLPGNSSKKSQNYSNQTPSEDERGINELNHALNRIEALTAEKNQLKNTLKIVLNRRPSEAQLDPNLQASGSQQSYSSPRVDALAEFERKIEILQRENRDLKYTLQTTNERLSATIKENNDYLEKMVEFERISNYNMHLKTDMAKLNRELHEVANKVKELEERERISKEKDLFEEDSGIQAASYLNHILGLLEKCDQNSNIVNCFMTRFENFDTLQKSIEEKRLGAIALMALKYISDLLTNSQTSQPATKYDMFSLRRGSTITKTNPQMDKDSSNLDSHRKSKFHNPSTTPFEANFSQEQRDNNVSKQGEGPIRRASKAFVSVKEEQNEYETIVQQTHDRDANHHHKNDTEPLYQPKEADLLSLGKASLDRSSLEQYSNAPFQDFHQASVQSSIKNNGLINSRKSSVVQQNEVHGDDRQVLPEKQEINTEIQGQYDRRSSKQTNDNSGFPAGHPNVTAFSNFPQAMATSQNFNEPQYPSPNYEHTTQNSYRNINGPQLSPSHHNPYQFAFPPTQGYFIPATYANQFPPYQFPPNNYISPQQQPSESYNHGDRLANSDSKEHSGNYHLNDTVTKAPTNTRANPLSSRRSEPVINTNLTHPNVRPLNTNHQMADGKNSSSSSSLANSVQRDFIKIEDRRMSKQTDHLKVNSSRSDRRESHLAQLKEQAQQVDSDKLNEKFEVDSEELNTNHASRKSDKQIQAGKTFQQRDSAIQNPEESILCKATQTSSRPSKHTTKREDVPPLNIGSMRSNTGGSEDRQLQRVDEQKFLALQSKNSDSLLLQSNSSPIKYAETSQVDENLSVNDSQEMTRPIHRNNSHNTESSSRLGRATLGVMGNSEFSKGSDKPLNDLKEIPSPSLSMKSSSQKSFRVSFGKTISLSQFGKEKARFDIVPNEMICITESNHKKSMSPLRKFDIITNEPRAYHSDTNGANSEKSRMNGQNPNIPSNQTHKTDTIN